MNPQNEILKVIADNPALLEALQELFEKQFEAAFKEDYGMTNEELGQIVRARLQGLERISDAFREIEKYKTMPAQSEMKNPAR